MAFYISLIISALLIIFWVWMFREMSVNDDIPERSTRIAWPPASKFEWTIYFIFLNIFAAGFYYFYFYKKDD